MIMLPITDITISLSQTLKYRTVSNNERKYLNIHSGSPCIDMGNVIPDAIICKLKLIRGYVIFI